MQHPQDSQQAYEGRNTVPHEEQHHLGAPRGVDGGEENSRTRGHDPYVPPETVAIRECLTGTTEAKSQPLVCRGRRNNLGSRVLGHPIRTQPHERGCKSPSPSLHGYSGTTNEILVQGRSIALPSPNEVQNAVDRSFR